MGKSLPVSRTPPVPCVTPRPYVSEQQDFSSLLHLVPYLGWSFTKGTRPCSTQGKHSWSRKQVILVVGQWPLCNTATAWGASDTHQRGGTRLSLASCSCNSQTSLLLVPEVH